MGRRQLRILYREFLFRVVDRELLSTYARGDLHQLFAQIAAVLVFLSACLSIPASDRGANESASLRLVLTLWFEHFVIATTMLAVGVVAILSWGAMFPDERDVQILAPLPIRARTILAAKLAAVVTTFGLTILAFHAIAGVVWPLALSSPEPPRSFPTYTTDPAMPPVPIADLRRVLDADLRESRESGWLRPGTGGGLTIAVSHRGERRVWSYGSARPDSIFQIGSVTKTFTGFLLARQIERGRVRLDSTVRALLPGVDLRALDSSDDRDITLGDLVTHHSGLPPMPMSFRAADRRTLFAHIGAADLYAFLRRHGVGQSAEAPFVYSNLGFGLLGHLLARESKTDYPALLRDVVTGPLGLNDTVVELSDTQRQRLLAGFDDDREAVPPTEFDVLEGAGALYSSAPDLLAWLEANLHPAPAIAAAIETSHVSRATARGNERVAFAWMIDEGSGRISHTGGVTGYTADAFFNPRDDLATVVLSNVAAGVLTAPIVGEHLRARLRGETAVSLTEVTIPASGGLRSWPRMMMAYWLTMLMASACVIGLVMGVQGVASAVLPRRYFVRVSSILQLTAFFALIGWYLLQPIVITSDALQSAQTGGLFSSSPSYWFLGLFQSLSGSPALSALSSRALLATTLALSTACLAYAVSYVRTLRGIAEEPDIAATTLERRPMPMIGYGPAPALVAFSLKTLFRSAQPRVVMAWYWGIGLALAIGFIKTPRGQELAAVADGGALEPSVPFLVAGILMMGAAVVAARSAFAMPRDLGANWVFRVIPQRAANVYGVARRRAMLAVTVVPVVSMAAVAGFWSWRWQPALAHVFLLSLLGLVLVEIADRGTRKIPFACSYLPGRSRLHIAIAVTFTVIVPLAVAAATLERDALRNRPQYALIAMVLAAAWLAARWYWSSSANGVEADVIFDDEPADRLLTLELWDSRQSMSFSTQRSQNSRSPT